MYPVAPVISAVFMSMGVGVNVNNAEASVDGNDIDWVNQYIAK
jgi:hypothetical protein